MGNTKATYFFKDKPVFGFDIGHGSLKVMQVERRGKTAKILGYGAASFDPAAINDGVIVQPKVIAKAALDLFKHHLVGHISTRRTVLAIPAYRTFTRLINLPQMTDKQLSEAVSLEAEQYIPMPLDELYLDYNVITRSDGMNDVFAVAVPRKIVDSQLELMQLLGLETVAVDTTIDAAGALFMEDKQSDMATVLIDFGSVSADLAVFDKAMLVTGTVSGGGQVFTNRIRDKLVVSQAEAQIIKTKYGLGSSKKQAEIITALDPVLKQLAQEVRRMMRYYQDRYGDARPIGQVLTLGGGANMPGLAEYLTDNLRLPARPCDPWNYCDKGSLQPPPKSDKTMYATVMGLALTSPRGLFL